MLDYKYVQKITLLFVSNAFEIFSLVVKKYTLFITMSAYGTLKAGSLILYEQVIQAQDVSLQDVHIQDLDADGINRLRTVQTSCAFSFNHVYGKEPLTFEEKIVGSGTSLYNSNSFISMSVTNTGDKVIRQSYRYFTCSPGESVFVVLSGSLSSNTQQVTGLQSRIGIFDDVNDKSVDTSCGNGFFFQLHDGVFQVVKRTSTNGTAQEDTVVNQSNFSEDILDGTGPSTLTFVSNRVYAFVIDMTWVGCGYVRMGIINNNRAYYVHTFNGQYSPTTFTKYSSLPIRYEISNISAGAHTDTVKCVAGSVWHDSVPSSCKRCFSHNTGTSSVGVSSSKTPILSFRLASSYNRTTFNIKSINILTDGETLIEVYSNITSLSSASWTSVNSSSNVEVDNQASSASGGILVKSIYSKSSDSFSIDHSTVSSVSSNMSGVSSIISICASKLIEPVHVFVSVDWEE